MPTSASPILSEGWPGSRLEPRRLALCPELSLWLLGDDVDLQQRVYEVFAIEIAPSRDSRCPPPPKR